MNINDLRTPAFLVDLDKLESNIKEYSNLTNKYNKRLVPMTKTHKSTVIANIQIENGVNSFLVGTLEEAIHLSTLNVREITIAYPLIGEKNLEIINSLLNKVEIILSLDSLEVAKIYNDFFKSKNKTMKYLLIVNTGLNRFGVTPNLVGSIVNEINELPNLKFLGISTHPGHVYKKENYQGVIDVACESRNAMKISIDSLSAYNIKPEVIATGSTPTFIEDVKDDVFNVLRPGNYVFYDAIQVALGVIGEDKCALTVLATVISNPRENIYILDCGSKCLGLDKGAHGNSNIIGYGKIIDHSELVIYSLSEEVAIVEALSNTSIRIGDKIRIIPNHSCSVANMTSYIIGVRQNKIEKLIEIDVRENSMNPQIL